MSQNTVLLQNRYRIRQVLGTGGFSTIYLAKDEFTGKDVAIKEFTAEHMDGLSTILRVNAYNIANGSEPQPVEDPAELSEEERLTRGLMQIRREAFILEQLAGTGGVPYPIGTFEENDTIYLVREYLEGMTCQDYMERFRGRIPYSLALYIMRGTLEILKATHELGYIHCDVSPINSFLRNDGSVCLIDWGNAADLAGSMEDHVVRQAVNERYASPEQHLSGHRLTPATDLYCLCATMYEAISGDQPRQAIDRLYGDPLVPLDIHVSDLPPFVTELIMSGLKLDPEERPQSAAEMIAAIDEEISFSVSPVGGTNNAAVTARLLKENRRPFGFLTSRRLRKATVVELSSPKVNN